MWANRPGMEMLVGGAAWNYSGGRYDVSRIFQNTREVSAEIVERSRFMKFRPSPAMKLLRRLVRSIEANGVHGAFVHSFQRLFRSLKNHGVRGTLSRAFIKAPVVPGRDAPEP